MDLEAWIWSHFSLDPSAQILNSSLRLTCLVCGAEVTHVANESRLSDHLRRNHQNGPGEDVNVELYGLLPLDSKTCANLNVSARRRKGETWAFFEKIAQKAKHSDNEIIVEVCKLCLREFPCHNDRRPLVKHLHLSHPELRIKADPLWHKMKEDGKNYDVKVEKLVASDLEQTLEAVDESKMDVKPDVEAEADSASSKSDKSKPDEAFQEISTEGEDFDLMLMASFEAEMRRQMAGNMVGDNSKAIAPSKVLDVSKGTVGRKIATTPEPVHVGNDDDRIRGASTPDDVEGALEDEAFKSGSDNALSIDFKDEPKDEKVFSNIFDSFVTQNRFTSPSIVIPELTRQPSSPSNSNEPFGQTFSSTASRKTRRSNVSIAASNKSQSAPIFAVIAPSVAESVKKRRSRVPFGRGVVKSSFDKIVRTSAHFWSHNRWTDFDFEVVHSRRCDDFEDDQVKKGRILDCSQLQQRQEREQPPQLQQPQPQPQRQSAIKIDSVFPLPRHKRFGKSKGNATTFSASIKHTIIGSFEQISKNRFRCLVCGKRFHRRRTTHLAKHMKLFHRRKLFSCGECHRKFHNNRLRLQHVAESHSHRRNRGEVSSSLSSSSVNDHRHRQCVTCSLVFKRVYSLKLHRCLAHKQSFRLKAKLISLDALVETVDFPPSKPRIEPDPILCCLCERVFVTETAFDSHRLNCSYGGSNDAEEEEETKRSVASSSSASNDAENSDRIPDSGYSLASSTVSGKAKTKPITNEWTNDSIASSSSATCAPPSSLSLSHLCPHCVKAFSSYDLLKRHVDLAHNARAILAARRLETLHSSISCTACDDPFLSTEALLKHFARRHRELETVECDWWTWSRDDDDWVRHSKPLVYHV